MIINSREGCKKRVAGVLVYVSKEGCLPGASVRFGIFPVVSVEIRTKSLSSLSVSMIKRSSTV